MEADGASNIEHVRRAQALFRGIRSQCKSAEEARKTTDMVDDALGYLGKHPVAQLAAMLTLPHANTVSEPYWRNLAEALLPMLAEMESSLPDDNTRREGVAHTLGWLYRIGRAWPFLEDGPSRGCAWRQGNRPAAPSWARGRA